MEIQPHVIDETTCPAEGWHGYQWKTLISSDRTPTAQITQGIADLLPAPPNMRLIHCHSHAETYYVVAGTGILWIGDKQHALAPGITAFIPGGAHHGAFATGTEPLRILYTFATDAFGDVKYEYPNLDQAAAEPA